MRTSTSARAAQLSAAAALVVAAGAITNSANACSLCTNIDEMLHLGLQKGDSIWWEGQGNEPEPVYSSSYTGDRASGTTVWLDYANFTTRLTNLAAAAGVTAFSPAEVSLIQSNIFSQLNNAYAGFSVNFSTIQPGGAFPTINFGLTASPGALGVADGIDYRNKVVNDVARVFTEGFTFILDEFTASTARSTQIAQLSAALAGTAAHELGHNLGLRHHDAYGYTSMSYDGSAVVPTGGLQNQSIMGTGSTGMAEFERESNSRLFSDHSLVKLSFAAGISTNVPATDAEGGGDFGDTTGTAHLVSLTELDVITRYATNITGRVGDTDDDVFAIDLEAGSTFTADVNLDFHPSIPFTNIDTVIELIAPDGSTVLALDNFSGYNLDFFGQNLGSFSGGDGFDPWLINVPIASTGRYYLRISTDPNNFDDPPFGDYELLMYTDIPGPAGFAVLAIAGAGLTRRRRAG